MITNSLKKTALSLAVIPVITSSFLIAPTSVRAEEKELPTPSLYTYELEKEGEFEEIEAMNTWRVGDRGSVIVDAAFLWRNATSTAVANRIGQIHRHAQVQVLQVSGSRVRVLVQLVPGANGHGGSTQWWINTSNLRRF